MSSSFEGNDKNPTDAWDPNRLCRLLARMAALDTLPAVSAAVEGVVEALGDQGGCILLEPHPHVLAARHESVSAGTPIDVASYPELSRAVAAGDLVVEAIDTDRGPRVSGRDLIPGGFHSVAVLPLAAGQRRLGWLWVCSRRSPHALSEGQKDTARLIARGTELILSRGLTIRDRGLASTSPVEGNTTVPVDRSVTPVWGVAVSHGERPRIMVVDDDADFAGEIGAALTSEGYDVLLFGSAAAALVGARKSPPALLMIDMHLPDSDGFLVARELASDRRTGAVPVIFTSADETLAARVRAFRAGDADFLRKPFELQDLLARIDTCLVRADRRNDLRRTARIDELTGLGNVRLLEERLLVEGSRLARYGTELAVVVADVDRLKAINDAHGHPTGSAALRAIGEALSLAIRNTDLAVRYGGDEFVVLLPHTHLQDAMRFSERLLTRIRQLRPSGVSVSVSLGVAAFDRARDRSVRDLLERADRAAYRAKRDGGDGISVDACSTDVSAA